MLAIHGSKSLFLRLIGIFDNSLASIIPRLSKNLGAKNIRAIGPYLMTFPIIPKLSKLFRLISRNMLFFKWFSASSVNLWAETMIQITDDICATIVDIPTITNVKLLIRDARR